MHFPKLSLNLKSIKSNNNEEGIKYNNLINTALKIGFKSIEPESMTKLRIKYENNILSIQEYKTNLDPALNKIYVVGGGKASYQVVRALLAIFGDQVVEGIINIPKNQLEFIDQIQNIELIPANHPFPDENTITGTQRQIKLLRKLKREDLVFAIITGGASSLLEVPLKGISLEDLVATYKILVKSGLSIEKINVIRKHLSIVKGGKLSTYTKAKLIGLYISDVPGNEISNIGSGPTIEDSSTYNDCYRYLNESGLFYELPPPVQEIIVNGFLGEIKETPKQIGENVYNFIIGTNKNIIEPMYEYLLSQGLSSTVCSFNFGGEAKEISNFLFKYSSFPYCSLPHCFIWGGESIVSIEKGENGIGGRNQELILSFLINIMEYDFNFANLIILSIGTDGIDGNSQNMGAFIDSKHLKNLEINLELLETGLLRHDSSNVLPSELILTTGQTYSNVGDLIILLLY